MANKEKTKKFTVSIIDIVVVLVIIAAIAVAAVMIKPKLFGKSTAAGGSKSVITLELTKQKEYMTQNIKKGETVYDAINNTVYGTVVDFRHQAATETVVSATDGTAKTVEIPQRYDIYIDIETNGVTAEVGKLVTVYAKSFKSSGYIVGVERELTGNEAAVKNIVEEAAE